MLLNKFVLEIVEHFNKEIKKEENITLLKQHLINPLIDYTFQRLYPYILVTSIIFFLTFILAVITFLLIFKSQS
jgi:hypothetical protein|uniref:Uncharacterized protein n=1 Tax=Mimiviridae sp. ChoanoV1 TaxID=2596887 RepID=A0A5B8HVN7_9VIRU|nr:hypothetical protein 1_58 [Mimiviridae sp. ChoanoV1]